MAKTAVAAMDPDEPEGEVLEPNAPTKPAKRAAKKPAAPKPLEDLLWESADKLRNKMDSAEYKHVVLGLIFLKYISDVFARHRRTLETRFGDPQSEWHMPSIKAREAMLEDRDSYTVRGVGTDSMTGNPDAGPPAACTGVSRLPRVVHAMGDG